MTREKKWILSTGKCAENELYAYGMQCSEIHPVHSFLLDLKDPSFQTCDIFRPNEIAEMKDFKKKPLPKMSP
jgi:hypothetical protein